MSDEPEVPMVQMPPSAPLPEQWSVMRFEEPDQPRQVVLLVNGPYGGPLVHYLDPDGARRLADSLRQAAGIAVEVFGTDAIPMNREMRRHRNG